MINLLKKFFLKFQNEKNLLINDDLKRRKINLIFQYLLSNYEIKLRGKVDLPAFCYASADTKQIIETGKIDFAYELIKKLLEGGKNEI